MVRLGRDPIQFKIALSGEERNRASNMILNECDLVISVGARLGLRQIGHMPELFAPNDKYSTLKDIVGEENIGSCAYFGDDVLDQKCMIPIRDAGGIVGCPSDAVQEVKAISDYTCLQKAGEGALR